MSSACFLYPFTHAVGGTKCSAAPIKAPFINPVVGVSCATYLVCGPLGGPETTRAAFGGIRLRDGGGVSGNGWRFPPTRVTGALDLV